MFSLSLSFFGRTVHNATPRRLLQARELASNQTQTHPKSQSSPVQSSASHLVPRWAIYALPVAGVLFIAAVATAIYVFFSRRKKDNTVMPWATGLSGQLKKAFVTGWFFCSIIILPMQKLRLFHG